jgi:succinate dehydrogenase/fumarate reductase cytochrome b subunit
VLTSLRHQNSTPAPTIPFLHYNHRTAAQNNRKDSRANSLTFKSTFRHCIHWQKTKLRETLASLLSSLGSLSSISKGHGGLHCFDNLALKLSVRIVIIALALAIARHLGDGTRHHPLNVRQLDHSLAGACYRNGLTAASLTTLKAALIARVILTAWAETSGLIALLPAVGVAVALVSLAAWTDLSASAEIVVVSSIPLAWLESLASLIG